MEQEEKRALEALREVVEEKRDEESRARLTWWLGVVSRAFEDRDRWAARVKALEARIERAVAQLREQPGTKPHAGVTARCSKCGGVHVECYAWVDPNEATIGEYVFDDDDHAAREGATWCHDCEDHVVLKWETSNGRAPAREGKQ